MDIQPNLIGGSWRAGKGTTENRNPSDLDDLIGLYAQGDAEDLAAAAAAARRASPGWAATLPHERGDMLARIAAGILRREQELATMLAREEGKILAEALAETRRAAQVFSFFAGETLRLSGEALASVRPGVDIEVTREPVGVVGLITPWNFPIAIPAWKIGSDAVSMLVL